MIGVDEIGVWSVGTAADESGLQFAVSGSGLASTLAIGAALVSFTIPSPFSVDAAGLASTLANGVASFAFSAPGAFAVSAVGVPSTLAIGQAAFNFVGVFTVPTPLYAARILDVPPDAMTSLIGFPMTVGWNKDVNETLDYGVDFTRVLALLTNDSIASYEVVADWDLNVLATTLRGNVVGVLVSGGRPGLISTISCRVTTVQGRVIEAPLYIQNIYR